MSISVTSFFSSFIPSVHADTEQKQTAEETEEAPAREEEVPAQKEAEEEEAQEETPEPEDVKIITMSCCHSC
jgi:ubiquinol-cytochrome c reductase subunit 6